MKLMVREMNKFTLSIDRVVWCLVVFLFSGIIVFELQLWNVLPYYGTLLLISTFYAIENKGKIKIWLSPYHVFMSLFILYTHITVIWAINKPDTFAMGRGLILNLLFSSILYFYYVKQNDIFQLLSAIKWAGYIIALYTIFFYGLNRLIMLSSSSVVRMENDYANVNGIAMLIAYSCIVEFFDFIYLKKRTLSVVMLIPSILVIAASQSRKAYLTIVVGIIAIYFFRGIDEKNFLKSMAKIIVGTISVVIILLIILRLPIFSGVNERLYSLVDSFVGNRSAGSYIPVRERLISLGISVWKTHPILGIGMANAHIVAASKLNFDAYLHCNYVELLCGGGLIGFLLYYSMHIYLMYSLWRYRNIERKFIVIGTVLLFVTLLTDYGQVSYYTKPECFYFAIQFINIEQLKRKAQLS